MPSPWMRMFRRIYLGVRVLGMGLGTGLGSGTGLRGEQAVVVSRVAVIRARAVVRRMWLGVEGIPQGLKPLFCCEGQRLKAEALGYLEAKATTTAKAIKAKATAKATATATAKAKCGDSSLRSE